MRRQGRAAGRPSTIVASPHCRPSRGSFAVVPGYVHDLPGKSLEEPLWPVLWSLSALLTSGDAGRLGFCQAEGCGWFFVDESPNHARTWCSSEVCGNRERARRAYAKRIRQLPSTAL